MWLPAEKKHKDEPIRMKESVRLLITALTILAGTALAAYPFLSNYLYEHQQEEIILEYDRESKAVPDEAAKKEWERAEEYNASLQNADVILKDPFDPEALSQKKFNPYLEILNNGPNNTMGYLEVPALDLRLGIYHGTDARALEAGVGHLEGSSFPIGGESSHAVLSAHTGLPGKKLFTDLELLENGDVFYIHVLGEILAYEVDQIKVVEPTNTKDLTIHKGKDYVTLLTCTPYGVNSHRLLVRGHRIPYVESEKEAAKQEKKAESQWMRQYFFGIVTGMGLLVLMLFIYGIYRRRRRHYEG